MDRTILFSGYCCLGLFINQLCCMEFGIKQEGMVTSFQSTHGLPDLGPVMKGIVNNIFDYFRTSANVTIKKEQFLPFFQVLFMRDFCTFLIQNPHIAKTMRLAARRTCRTHYLQHLKANTTESIIQQLAIELHRSMITMRQQTGNWTTPEQTHDAYFIVDYKERIRPIIAGIINILMK